MNDTIKLIESKMTDLKYADFPKFEEAKFFESNLGTINKILKLLPMQQIIEKSDYLSKEQRELIEKNLDEIACLFVIFYRSFHHDKNNFEEIKQQVLENKKLIQEILDTSICVCQYELNTTIYVKNRTNSAKTDAKNCSVTLNLNMDLIKGTVFDTPEYIDALKKMKLISSMDPKLISNTIYSELKGEIGDDIRQTDLYKIADHIQDTIFQKIGVYKIENDMENYYNNNLAKNTNKDIISVINKYNKYVDLRNILLDIDKLPFVVDAKLIEDMPEDVLIQLYKDASILNQKGYQDLNIKANKLLNDSFKLKKYELIKSGYDTNKIEQTKLNTLLKYAELDEITKVISFVNKLSYELIDLYSDNGIYILINTSYEIVKKINELIEQKIISLNFVWNNPRIFFEKDIYKDTFGLNQNMSNNFKLLKDNYNLKDSLVNELLLVDYNMLKKNIDLSKSYSEKLNINVLNDNKIFDIIDQFIETGLSDIVKNRFEIIDLNSTNIMKRFYVSNLLGLTDNKLDDMIITGNKFYISDNELDDYIINNVDDYIPSDIKNILDTQNRNIIKEDLEINLSKYEVDELTLNIDDIIISKNKVFRNLTCLLKNGFDINDENVLSSAIIYGSILESDKIEKIKNSIYAKKYAKKIDI